MYQSESSWGTKGRMIDIPRGKTLGGSSSINGVVFNRGQSMDFNVWAQKGNLGWSYADVLPYFKKMEHKIGLNDEGYHGKKPHWKKIVIKTSLICIVCTMFCNFLKHR